MNFIKLFINIIAFLSIYGISIIAIANNNCPDSIETNQSIINQPLNEWNYYTIKSSHPLIGISFYNGPPDQNALLTPRREQHRGKQIIATWAFSMSEKKYWIACEYAKTTIIVTKQLQPDTRECTVEYDGNFSVPVPKKWSCHSHSDLSSQ